MSHFILFSEADGHDYGRLMQHMLNERGQQTDALMERVGELRQQFCDEQQVFFPNMSNQLLFRSVEALARSCFQSPSITRRRSSVPPIPIGSE